MELILSSAVFSGFLFSCDRGSGCGSRSTLYAEHLTAHQVECPQKPGVVLAITQLLQVLG